MAIESLFSRADPSDVRDAVAKACETLRAAEVDLTGLSDDHVIAAAGELEQLGRMLDALRVSIAGEIDERSKRHDDEGGLAARYGCRSTVELLQRLTLAAPRTINERLRVARAVRPRVSLVGEDLPPDYPATGEALSEGEVGIDAAAAIIDTLRQPAKVCDPNDLLAAEAALAAAAAGRERMDDPETPSPPACTHDELRIQARVWALWLDQDGAEPTAEQAERRRYLRLGPEKDGNIPIRGCLTLEIGARLKRLFDAYENPAQKVRFIPDRPDAVDVVNPPSDSPSESLSASTDDEASCDPRTREQRMHDLLAVVLDAAARAENAPRIGGADPTVIITATREDVASGTGVAHIEGIETPVPIRVAQREACANAAQKIVLGPQGEVLELGSPTRLFTAHQRRAIIARDGGCVIPGCTIPAGWCEVHHVREHRDGGETHTGNGVLLCWWHHHHLPASGWTIRMIEGVPHVRAPRWVDPLGRFRPATSSHTRRRAQLSYARGAPPGSVTRRARRPAWS